MGAARDCEAILDAFLAQPVNALTTLAFVAGGAVVLWRSKLAWVGIALVATGVGSFLFHGPMPSYADWAHDASLAWLLLVVAGVGRSWQRCTEVVGLAVVAALVAIPGAADPVAVAIAGAAIVLLVMHDRSIRTFGPLSLLAVVATIGRLGAAGGPLCDPSSSLQPHGLWHVGAATAVVWWALARENGARG